MKKQPLPEGREQPSQQQSQQQHHQQKQQHQEAEKDEHQQLEKQFDKQPQKEQQITPVKPQQTCTQPGLHEKQSTGPSGKGTTILSFLQGDFHSNKQNEVRFFGLFSISHLQL